MPPQLGLALERYKWRQSQAYVEVFVRVPAGLPAEDVHVQLTATECARARARGARRAAAR